MKEKQAFMLVVYREVLSGWVELGIQKLKSLSLNHQRSAHKKRREGSFVGLPRRDSLQGLHLLEKVMP